MGLSAELNFDTSFGKITSITAWRNFESTIGQDADYSTGDVLWRNTARSERQRVQATVRGAAFLR